MSDADLPKRLCAYAVQLERSASIAAMGGDTLAVRVADPNELRRLLEDAALALIQANRLLAAHPTANPEPTGDET